MVFFTPVQRDSQNLLWITNPSPLSTNPPPLPEFTQLDSTPSVSPGYRWSMITVSESRGSFEY